MLAFDSETDFLSRREVEYVIVRQNEEPIGNQLVRTAVHTKCVVQERRPL